MARAARRTAVTPRVANMVASKFQRCAWIYRSRTTTSSARQSLAPSAAQGSGTGQKAGDIYKAIRGLAAVWTSSLSPRLARDDKCPPAVRGRKPKEEATFSCRSLNNAQTGIAIIRPRPTDSGSTGRAFSKQGCTGSEHSRTRHVGVPVPGDPSRDVCVVDAIRQLLTR